LGVSDNGQYWVGGAGAASAGRFYLSTDSGSTWTKTPTTGVTTSIAISSTGQYIVQSCAVSTTAATILMSNDYGSTLFIPSGITGTYDRTSVTISESGQYVMFIGWLIGNNNGKTWRSTDYGASFTLVSSSFGNGGIAMSETGEFVYIVQLNTSGGIYNIYKSTDYGASFTGGFTPISINTTAFRAFNVNR